MQKQTLDTLKNRFYWIALALPLGLFMSGLLNCTTNKVPAVVPGNSTSASEVVAAVISGTVNLTMANGTQAFYLPKKNNDLLARIMKEIDLLPKAEAQLATTSTCPTLQAGNINNCSVNGAIMTLPYVECNFPALPLGALWQGNMFLTSTNPAAPVSWACGTFPTFVAGNTITRTFSAPTDRILLSYPANSTGGLPVLQTVLDTSQSVNGGVTNSGITITFSGAVARKIVINGIHVGANYANYNVWDYQLNSDTTGLDVSAGNVVSTFPTSGIVTIQDMRNTGTVANPNPRIGTLKVTGALGYSPGCCMPTSGTITTTWSDSTPTETLAFNATCNSATLNGQPLTLTQCL